MDQYPDENEEYELHYQDELELMDELPIAEDAKYLSSSTQVLQNAAKLDNISFELDSSQLSQIPLSTYQHTTVNRRLFGTPKISKHPSSTPLIYSQNVLPIADTIQPEEEPSTSQSLLQSPLREGTEPLNQMNCCNKRRLEMDLFGDIDDIYYNETYEDPQAKKARTEEERDLEEIQRILNLRKQFQESNKIVLKDNLEKLKAIHKYKMENLSYLVPKWPFMLIKRDDGQAIYLRFHSKEYEVRAINEIHSISNHQSVFGEDKTKIWNEANEILLRRMTQDDTQMDRNSIVYDTNCDFGEALWVDKYKPRKYVDLLSDETTNRNLLYWLKMWDKIVFGKPFRTKHINGHSQLNSFNKRTGKFESNGGWNHRKNRQHLNTDIDDLGRPMQKIALLFGPPGLGKTTLAHTVAHHAGYIVREINASDDRSPEAFKQALENGTQMSSVLNKDKRPNCIILDEIDGAPRQSIEFLVKFVTDNTVQKTHRKIGKAHRNILKRPIICICNDAYEPALRALRQIAFIIKLPLIDSSRLAERLEQIARREKLKTDFGALFALAEKCGNDVRACISTMQFFAAKKTPLTLLEVLQSSMGQKDRHGGLFDIWSAIFSIQRPKKILETDFATKCNNLNDPQIVMSDMSLQSRVKHVLQIVHTGSEYERLTQGVFENYLHQKMPDPNLNGIVDALYWFEFSDHLQYKINNTQNYSIYPYQQYGFAMWHLLFASLAWPKINFPTRGYEFAQKSTNQKNIFQSFRRGISSNAVGIGHGKVVLTEFLPLLKRIISPRLRSVAFQLLSSKEQYDLRHTVEIMVDLGLTYTQVKASDGIITLQLEPDINILIQFPDFPSITLSYFGKQLLSREVELERVRRSTPKLIGDLRDKSSKSIPNHLQRLVPKKPTKDTKTQTTVSKDFFGRIRTKAKSALVDEVKTDSIVKSPIWYRYKEGVNRAVRKDVHMNDLF